MSRLIDFLGLISLPVWIGFLIIILVNKFIGGNDWGIRGWLLWLGLISVTVILGVWHDGVVEKRRK